MKEKVRKEILQRLKEISLLDRQEQQNQLYHQLFQLKEWKDAKIVGVTLSFYPELDTSAIIQRALKEKKVVAVPKIKNKKMYFVKFHEQTRLRKTTYGAMEPIDDCVIEEAISLLIVPGIAFNLKSRQRIGFGGGYYDKYLSTFKGKTVSLVLKVQQTDFIQFEAHDISIQKILTI